MLKLGLVGETLSHSYSQEIHTKIMSDHHIDGTYQLIEIPKDKFEDNFNALKHSDYDGVNITIPYKERVIPLLDEISSQAKYIGAVNTVHFQENKAIGYNTDYHGFLSILKNNDIKIKGKSAIILGSGGVAKAVIKALLDEGIFDITIVSRQVQNFHSLYTISYEYLKEAKLFSDLLINCTPVGMYPQIDASPIPKEVIHANVVIDTIYNPAKTQLLQYAEELGITALNGSKMLFEQALEAQRIWNSNKAISQNLPK